MKPILQNVKTEDSSCNSGEGPSTSGEVDHFKHLNEMFQIKILGYFGGTDLVSYPQVSFIHQ